MTREELPDLLLRIARESGFGPVQAEIEAMEEEMEIPSFRACRANRQRYRELIDQRGAFFDRFIETAENLERGGFITASDGGVTHWGAKH